MTRSTFDRAGLVVTGAALFLLSGCAHDRQPLSEAVYEYTQGVRWGHHSYVTRYLAPRTQAKYLARREQIGDLRVTKCRVTSLRVHAGSRATATLSVHWFRLSRGRVHKTSVEQEWKRVGKHWRVVRQVWLRGAALPIFPNPAADAPSRT